MAGYADIVRNGVALANTLTATLQSTVTHHVWTGQDGLGAATYASPVTRTAIVERKRRMTQTLTGQIVESQASILFLEPTAVDERDKVVLQDGTTGPVLTGEGVVDPATGLSYYTQIYLGTGT